MEIPTNHPGVQEVHNPRFQIQRTLRKDVAEIGELLAKSQLDDKLTETIRTWYQNFEKALNLKNIDLGPVFDKYVDLLEEILIIPELKIPLDEDTVLGNDKKAYGYKYICLFLANETNPFKGRSPLNPEDPTPFTAEPHDVARFLVRWLKVYKQDFVNETIESDFQKLRKIPIIPGLTKSEPVQAKPSLADTIKGIQERQKNRENRRQIRTTPIQTINENIDRAVKEAFTPLNNQVLENHAAKQNRLDNLEIAFEAAVVEIKKRQQQLDERGDAIDRDLKELQDQLNVIGENVESAKADNVRLQAGIKETEKAINEREKGGLKDLLTIALIIGACWAGGQILAAAMKAGGSAATASVTCSKATTKLTLTFAF